MSTPQVTIIVTEGIGTLIFLPCDEFRKKVANQPTVHPGGVVGQTANAFALVAKTIAQAYSNNPDELNGSRRHKPPWIDRFAHGLQMTLNLGMPCQESPVQRVEQDIIVVPLEMDVDRLLESLGAAR
jgi:hypothetical protein